MEVNNEKREVPSTILSCIRYSLLILKMYNTHYIHYRFLVLTVNHGLVSGSSEREARILSIEVSSGSSSAYRFDASLCVD